MTAARNKKMDRQIKGIFIPIEIWQDNTLTWKEKVLLMEIDSFTSKDLDCYFSNEYIATLLGVKEDTASGLVRSLIRKGFIRQTRFDGRKRYLQTCIEIQSRVGLKSEADSEKNPMQTRTEIQHNNITNKLSNISSKEDSIKAERFGFRVNLIKIGVEQDVADAWMQVRKEKKAVNTKIAFEAVYKEIQQAEKAGHSANECIRLAVEKSWAGFKWSWMKRELDDQNAPAGIRPTPLPPSRHDSHLDIDFSQFYK